MKRQIIALAAGAALIAAPLMTNMATADMPGGRRGNKMEKMATELNLSPQQKEEMQAIWEAAREDMKAIRQKADADMKSVLDPEQQQKFDEMKQQRQAKREAKRQQWKNKQDAVTPQ